MLSVVFGAIIYGITLVKVKAADFSEKACWPAVNVRVDAGE